MLTNSWLKNLTARVGHTTARPKHRRSAFRPVLEALEDRLAPATFTVLNTTNAGAGSLRQAIVDANATANVGGVADVIAFNIPGAGVHTISVGFAPLPTITDPVVIDGYTQPGTNPNTLANGDNAVLRIELNGINTSGGNGLHITAGNSIVRGLVINRFAGFGDPSSTDGYAIRLSINGANTIEGNFLGTDATGTISPDFFINCRAGVGIHQSANNLIGGNTPEARNVISGNGGLLLGGNNKAGINIVSASGNRIQGNFIGVDRSGTTALGNRGFGVWALGAVGTVIGGTGAGERNIISSNSSGGISFRSSNDGNQVQGNFIGTDVTGTLGRGNQGNGVFVSGSNNVMIGGSLGGANTIAFNFIAGVAVFGGTGNAFLSNSIYSNGDLGIDLAPSFQGTSVTVNDIGDPDTGPNNLQNFPVITAASSSGNSVTVVGTLNSTAATVFRVEFFTNPVADPSGFGEGTRFLGARTVTTDASGNGSFAFALALTTPVPVGHFITATATDPGNNTSEFSQDRIVQAPVNVVIDGNTTQAFLNSLTSVTGNLILDASARTDLLLPNLVFVGGNFTVTGNASLTQLDAPLLATVNGNVTISNNLLHDPPPQPAPRGSEGHPVPSLVRVPTTVTWLLP